MHAWERGQRLEGGGRDARTTQEQQCRGEAARMRGPVVYVSERRASSPTSPWNDRGRQFGRRTMNQALIAFRSELSTALFVSLRLLVVIDSIAHFVSVLLCFSGDDCRGLKAGSHDFHRPFSFHRRPSRRRDKLSYRGPALRSIALRIIRYREDKQLAKDARRNDKDAERETRIGLRSFAPPALSLYR